MSDQLNPCVSVSLKAGAKFSGGDSEREDLSRMIYAKNLVHARSSFSRAAMYLSPIKKQFWVFHGVENRNWNYFDWTKRFFLEFGPHTNSVASKNYSSMLGRWKHNDQQIQLIQTEKCRWQKADFENYSDNCSFPSPDSLVNNCE
jgi:hypothetical protein